MEARRMAEQMNRERDLVEIDKQLAAYRAGKPFRADK
jgi:hypothetical protein